MTTMERIMHIIEKFSEEDLLWLEQQAQRRAKSKAEPDAKTIAAQLAFLDSLLDAPYEEDSEAEKLFLEASDRYSTYNRNRVHPPKNPDEHPESEVVKSTVEAA